MRIVFVSLLLAALALPVSASELTDRLKSAAPAAGEAVFNRCKACHTIEQNGKHRVGPNLWGIVGRPVASAEGFRRYSPALKKFGGTWTPERLDTFLENPRKTVKGVRMMFPGLPKAGDRADVIAYLNQNGPSPMDFGASAEAESPPAAEKEEDFGVLFNAPGVAETFYACNACHSERIVAQQGLSRERWEAMLVWMVEEQGMEPLPADEEKVILDYLSTHYNEDRPHFPR